MGDVIHVEFNRERSLLYMCAGVAEIESEIERLSDGDRRRTAHRRKRLAAELLDLQVLIAGHRPKTPEGRAAQERAFGEMGMEMFVHLRRQARATRPTTLA